MSERSLQFQRLRTNQGERGKIIACAAASAEHLHLKLVQMLRTKRRAAR